MKKLLENNRKLTLFFLASSSLFVLGLTLCAVTIFGRSNIATAAVSTWIPLKGKEALEIHVANNGMAYLRGAKVTSISGSMLNVETSWNDASFVWQVQTNGVTYNDRHFGTRFLDLSGKDLEINQIRVGDIVVVSGKLDVNSKTPTIQADVIRIAN